MDMIIFGMPAFQSQYMIHKNKSNQLGIAPMNASKRLTNSEKTKDVASLGSLTQNRVGGLPWWSAVIVISVVFGVSFALFYVYFMDFIEGKFPDNQWI